MNERETTSSSGVRPAALRDIAESSIVHLDVRDDLRNGREPFAAIMEARDRVPPGGALTVRAIFEPAPLYRVLGAQGFDHWTERLADDDWRVWFFRARTGAPAREPRPDDPGPEPRPGAREEPEDAAPGGRLVLDVRGLEPPEPMVRTLGALEELPEGATLVQLNERVPRFLLPRLEERGFAWEIQEESDLVRVSIRRREDPPSRSPSTGHGGAGPASG